jgi:hypothetical protein
VAENQAPEDLELSSFIPAGVFVGALLVSLGALWLTIKPKIGQITDALYGRTRFSETPVQARWRRVHMEADAREKELAQ